MINYIDIFTCLTIMASSIDSGLLSNVSGLINIIVMLGTSLDIPGIIISDTLTFLVYYCPIIGIQLVPYILKC